MEKIDLNEYLASNEYPGRGIAVAKAPDGRQMFIGYFIMGRSENSRNRVFDPVPERGGICTMAADPAKLEDPSLIIYNPVLTLGRTHIVTNGDQTDTIYDLMSQGKSFADALRTRTFEPDGPNYTPRISAVVYADGSYQMSILKSADGNGDSVQRYFFDYPQPVAGEGHFISTYKHNGSPIPSFEGEPLRFACPRTIGDFAHDMWSSLNLDNNLNLNFTYTDICNSDFNNVYTVTLNPDRTFDLSSLPGNFDISRVTGWVHGNAEGNTLTVDEGTNVVYYGYQCRSNMLDVSFTLDVTGTGGTGPPVTPPEPPITPPEPPVTPPSGGGDGGGAVVIVAVRHCFL